MATKPESIKLGQINNGDFHSVSLDEAIKRLQNVAEEALPPEETKCYNVIREHRNRLVHFFHEAYVKKPSKELIEQIILDIVNRDCLLVAESPRWGRPFIGNSCVYLAQLPAKIQFPLPRLRE